MINILIIINPTNTELEKIKRDSKEEILIIYKDNLDKIDFDNNITTIYRGCSIGFEVEENGNYVEYNGGNLRIKSDELKEYPQDNLFKIKVIEIKDKEIKEYNSFNEYLDRITQKT
ncbi:MAG: hypothetical protein QXY18_03045 [Nitrososphaerota archaeon]|nr:hypothetical protein [Candidatus Aenigmarchaeota archaeon]